MTALLSLISADVLTWIHNVGALAGTESPWPSGAFVVLIAFGLIVSAACTAAWIRN